MRLHIRRIKMDDASNRADKMWLLFDEGKIDTPIACISDFDLDCLLDEIDRQRDVDDGE